VAGEPKTFQLLALAARETGPDGKPLGRSFLGALKADVDNLGLLFSIGLQDRLSVSRFASLSRMLNHFFSADLVAYLSTEFPDLYVIFAGGDDLFLLGPWNQVIRFAEQLRERFTRFVAHRPCITLSAGVAVVKPTLPVQAIAEQTESLLEASKHHPGKNAITLFDRTVGWDDFSRLVETGDWLHDLVAEGIIPRSLLGRLMAYGKDHRAFMDGDIQKGLYLSQMAYDFARNLKEKQLPDPVERAELLKIQQDGFLLSNMQIPASFALYRLRKEG
jgi:CRISPR-associated protein Csm1